ncbi:hypothetical protein AJ79_07398 [Helicocarpus griseus UAMH5409]|uniref:Aminoglycoside phosphotransferase domain-containing protein n=1 Tax=Helicocarpus griseus UAMH5409 TaxID=1447875 RepID=A0A2B7X389_9EURO|nr:hypothetical protein AJ79_07398 [Helicocarpus griseus UAMH5409]
MSLESDKEEGEELHFMGSRRITRYGPDKVIKSGNTDISEADAQICRGPHYDPLACIQYGRPKIHTNAKLLWTTSLLGGYIAQLRALKGAYIGRLDRSKATVADINAFGVEKHEIAFAHGDLSPWNVMVGDQAHITAIIDCEDSGWYPEYWEYYRALRVLTPVDGWPEYFHYIFPYAYKAEYIGLSYLSIISSSYMISLTLETCSGCGHIRGLSRC